MGIVKNVLNSLVVRNAVQQQKNGFNNSNFIKSEVNPYDLFYGGMNKAGRYDNYYDNSNRIITTATKYPLYYAIDNEVQEPDTGTFAYYIKNPNDSYPQRKVMEQVYTELITHGYSDLFFWYKKGSNESCYFDTTKKLDENLFRGFTLVSGYDKARFKKQDTENIVRLTYGSSQANVFMGYSPSQAAESWRKMQDEMGLHMTAFAKNAGLPIGQWVITANSPEEYKKIKAGLEKKISGAKNNGKQLFSYQPSMSKEVQIKWVQFTSQDVQDYTKQMEFSDKKIDKNFGVPGSVKGVNDGENYATANVSKQGYIEWTIEPLVSTVREQLDFHISKRFDLKGEIKADVEIPELADESLVKIQATSQEVLLFDQKISEGYTAESIIKAFDLPERFLLLEKQSGNKQNTPEIKSHAHNCSCGLEHKEAVERNELERHYQNTLSKDEKDRLESGFNDILQSYTLSIIENGQSDESKEDFEGKMVAHFGTEYANIYDITLDDVADALDDAIDVTDVESLNLTDEELILAKDAYNERVKEFSKSFADFISDLDGDSTEIKVTAAQPHIQLTAVTESEHTRIVSELNSWTKAQEEFPVRVYKTWNALPGACPICIDLEGTTLDVTGLFVDNPSNEIYEVTGGNAHPQCRCYVKYKMEAKDE